MTTWEQIIREKEQKNEWIKEQVEIVGRTYGRVLVRDCYEGYEFRQLKKALENLLEEVNKKAT